MNFFILVSINCVITVLCSASRESQLFDAIINSDVNEVVELIESGVDVNDQHWNFLHFAVLPPEYFFNEEILKLLITNGANLEAFDKFKRTPLMEAVWYENIRAIEILLSNGASPNTKFNTTDRSILEVAFSKSDKAEDIINSLLEHGAHMNETFKDGQTVLHKAILAGYKKTIKLLINKCTAQEINAKEKLRNMTPLHYMAIVDSSTLHGRQNWSEDDRIKYAKLLLDHGADLYAEAQIDGDDKTAFDIASTQRMRKLLGSKMGFIGWLRMMW